MTRARLFVSDLDNTLLGDDDALEHFIEWWHVQREPIRLVFASGRFYDSVLESIKKQGLPAPDAIIGGVGTEIQLYPSGAPLRDWSERWWPQWDAARIRQTFCDHFGFTLQPEEFQSDFKTSYYVPDASASLLRSANRVLAERGCRAQLIYSSRRDLDVVPYGANKGTAAMFLARYWDIARNSVIVAGDSGNDLSLFQQNCRGIVVANAHDDLKRLTVDSLVYHSPFAFAAGVIDGLRYWENQEQACSTKNIAVTRAKALEDTKPLRRFD